MTAAPDTASVSPAEAGTPKFPLTEWLFAAVLAGSLSVAVRAIAPLLGALPLALVIASFAVPGILVAREVYGSELAAGGVTLLVGPVWGYVVSNVALLGLWVARVRHPIGLATAPVVALLAIWPARFLRGAVAAPKLGRRDLAILLLLLLIVPLVVGRPFARVGETVPEGRAYRAYFTADFVWAITVAAEVSKGDVPPRNPFYQGDVLRYYWLSHFLSAVEYRYAAPYLSIEQVLLVNAIFLDLLFLGFFYLFARQFVTSPVAAGLGCGSAFLLSSFEGTDRLLALWRAGAPLSLVRYLNIDAITRWTYAGMPVDGLHRMLLYQPHHLMGYAAGLAALLLLVQARNSARLPLAACLGSLLAASLLFSSFIALIIGGAVAGYYALRLATSRQWRAVLPCAIAGALPVAGSLAVVKALGYVDPAGPIVRIGLNATATHRWPLVLFLSFGPLLVGGVVGAILAIRSRAASLVALGCLVASSVFFYFLVDVPDMEHVWVGWRAGHLLFIGFAALSAFALEHLWKRGPRWRGTSIAVGLLLAAAAVPTTVIDLYNSQDISNRQPGPGFHWTVILSRDDLEALAWLRQSTPPEAIVQVEPDVRGRETWGFVPAFAERRMAAGLPIAMVPLKKYETASQDIERFIYRAAYPELAYQTAVLRGVDFLVIGAAERQAYPAFQGELDQRPELFQSVFRNGTVAIYRVVHQRRHS